MTKRANQFNSFDPSKYSHMHRMQIHGWVREFLLRHDKASKTIEAYISLAKEYFDLMLKPHDSFRERMIILRAMRQKVKDCEHQFYNKYKVTPRVNKLHNEIRFSIKLNSKVTAYRIFMNGFRAEEIVDSEITPERAAMDKSFRHIQEDYNICNYGITAQKLMENLLGHPDESGKYFIDNVLFIRISLDSTRDEILDAMSRILKIHKPYRHKTTKTNNKLWKEYIIAYDLRKQGLSYRAIADEMAKAYPEQADRYFEKNVENFYKAAKKLINGEYVKYI